MKQFMLIALVTLVSLAAQGQHAAAQTRRARVPYYSQTPTISPYVHLFRGDTGSLNSYFSIVRPRQDYFRQFQLQANRSSVLQNEIDYLNYRADYPGQVAGIQQRPTSASTPRRPAARFMSFSQFYPSAGTIPRRQ